MSYGDSPNIKFWDVGSGELKFEISQTQTKESGGNSIVFKAHHEKFFDRCVFCEISEQTEGVCCKR